MTSPCLRPFRIQLIDLPEIGYASRVIVVASSHQLPGHLHDVLARFLRPHRQQHRQIEAASDK
jgi:hypothetical protein